MKYKMWLEEISEPVYLMLELRGEKSKELSFKNRNQEVAALRGRPLIH